MGTRNRKNLTEEQCFFVTSTFVNWFPMLNSDTAFGIISDNIIHYNKKYSAETMGYVFMPNHIHFIIWFIEQSRLSDYMRDFKKYTSAQLRRLIEREKPEWINQFIHEQRTQKYKLWMDRFDDVWLRDCELLRTKLNYIHENPVKKNFCTLPEQYQWSSARYYLNTESTDVPIKHYLNI